MVLGKNWQKICKKWKKGLSWDFELAKLPVAGDGTFLPVGFPTLTSLASVTGAFFARDFGFSRLSEENCIGSLLMWP
jgi:hypothetical protein